MKRIALLIAGALVAGCQADATTSMPSSSAIDQAAASPAAASRTAARLALDDVVERIVPALGEGVGKSGESTRLAGALRSFRAALDEGRIGPDARITHDAELALDSFAQQEGISLADVDAIRLALNAAIVR